MGEAAEASGKREQAGPGARRAAAVLLGLGPELAAPIFRLLGEVELRQIALGSKQLKRGPQNAVPDALGEFATSMGRVGGDAAAGDDLLRQIASQALGADAMRRAFDGVAPPPPPDEVLGPIAQADPESLAMVLAREQEQTIALVLSSIAPDRAAAVLELLGNDVRPQVVRRMATIESVAPEVLREVGQALAAELRSVVAGGMRKVDGKNAALEILRRTPSSRQGDMVAAIEKDDPALAADLRSRLFTFDDLLALSDRDLQSVIKELDMARLGVALKGASQELKRKFLKNLSTRAGEMLNEDLEAMGAVKLASVEEAQNEISRIALSLAEEDRITIVRPADKMV
jgi:flagellar motor switch protein FliG